jgi:uncharacterized protein YcbX
MRLDRGAVDAMPVSVISDSTVSTLCTLARVPGNELRFRPNVVVTLDSGAPFEEDEWVGSAVRIGAAVVRMDRRDSRCIIVNTDPASGLQDSHLLKVIGTARGHAPAFTERLCYQASSALVTRSSSRQAGSSQMAGCRGSCRQDGGQLPELRPRTGARLPGVSATAAA